VNGEGGKKMTGYITTTCPECGIEQKVLVDFPLYNAGFTPTAHTCVGCGEHLTVTDPHEYNEDGTIK
jgi:uncharacterized protein (DUF983 family)